MKILSAEQIRTIDRRTLHDQKITSLELMEQAAVAFFRWFLKQFPDKSKKIGICSGVGNNGGDGLVVARLLSERGYDVQVFIVEFSKKQSPDFTYNLARIKKQNLALSFLVDKNDVPDFTATDVLIDALFGTGLLREVEGVARRVIEKINASGSIIVSVDVPSGMFLDKHTEFAVKSTYTVTFQIPKLAYFLPENKEFIKTCIIEDIGLSQQAIKETYTNAYFVTLEDIGSKLRPLDRFTHKGTQGHALIIGGSRGKTGAAILSSKAALRSGCGLVTAYLPKCAALPMQAYFPEAMVLEDKVENFISDIFFQFLPDAIGVGPGLGLHKQTQAAFYRFIKTNKAPLVIDADGLNILSANSAWVDYLPPKTILTPHPKELSRLIGQWEDDFDKISKITRFVKKYDSILVLKGAYSMVFDAESIYVNSSGTPALATAGSGDVLTGILTGLRAQGYCALDSALIGVFLHGLTVDVASQNSRSFIASDIIENIGKAYDKIEQGEDKSEVFYL